jgi:hypothetical protein
MENSVVVEWLSGILRRLEILQTKIDVTTSGYACMTQLAYLREHRFEDYRSD